MHERKMHTMNDTIRDLKLMANTIRRDIMDIASSTCALASAIWLCTIMSAKNPSKK